MLDILSAAWIALGGSVSPAIASKPINLMNWEAATVAINQISQPAVQAAIARPDPQARQIVAAYLDRLAAQGLDRSGQSVWVQVGQTPIATHLGHIPLPAASLTKVATTLAALMKWGPDYRFETLVTYTGTLTNGVVSGDLIVQSSGDPFFVWEEAIALGNALAAAGIQTVQGRLLVTPNFTMNFEVDPLTSATLLKQGLNAAAWDTFVTQQYQTLPPGTPQPQVQIQGDVGLVTGDGAIGQPLVRHESLPLSAILKSMNIYSNNEMAEQLADLLGGADAVADQAAIATGLPRQTLRLINGSGLGVENQLSAQTVVAMFLAIQSALAPTELNVADLFPVAGRDQGTLLYRAVPTASAVKTGTLNAVCTLAGVMPTRDRGLVWFAILNQGPDLEGLRAEQDRLLQDLQAHWGAAQPLPLGLQPQRAAAGDRLGDARRNTLLATLPTTPTPTTPAPTSLRNHLRDHPPTADHDGLVF